MRQNLHLYIGDMEVEFNQPPDILYTYQTTELTNPTVIKNSFSKQITIYGSPNNNNIFGQYWNVERLQGTSNGIGSYFNPSKKVPFKLYINGDIYESGYVKLDEVKIVEGKSVEYNITLYGGLGQFFYNLSTDWNTGNKRSLADLNYYAWTDSTEPLDLSFTINKETVASAWTEIRGNDVYGVINFAPTYNGYPDSIDTDKAIMNFNGLTGFSSSVTIDNKTYSTNGGYALATLPAKLMAEEVRDYRSYLQTPVIRVKNIIEAICRKENNSGLYDNGYEVELDSDFFNSSNPYYYDSWMTLPLLTNLEFSTEGEGGSTAYTHNYAYVNPSQGGYLYTFKLDEPVTGSNKHIYVEFDMAVTANCESNWLEMGNLDRCNAYAVQLYASNSFTSTESILDGSKIEWCTHELMDGTKYTINNAIKKGLYSPKFNASSEYISGRWHKVSGTTTYLFNKRIKLDCSLPVGSTCFKIEIARSNSSRNEEAKILYDYSVYNQIRNIPVTLVPLSNSEMLLSAGNEGASFSNRYITKQMLLGTDFSPCDFLLSYCKQFGLYIYKDRVEDKIYIKTRKNFYNRDKIVDIQDDIDRLKDITVKPLNIDYGFFALTNSGVSSSFYNDYVNKYGKIYGQKIIATGYDFNADTKNLIDSVFKGAVQAKEMSQYFYTPNTTKVHPYMYNSVKYALYENGDYESGSTDVKAPFKAIADEFNPYDTEFPGYDYISQAMFYDNSKKALGTEYTLLFFDGYEDIPLSYNWNLTDDISAMYKLNNNPCWLMTTSSADTNGNTIALPITHFPKFGRWYEGNKWMIYSWDFGSPRELYVPNMTNNDEGNIYWNYFKTYYEDAYDVNSKIVNAYVINKDFTQDDLRNFYWFDNSIWRLNKIEDYNITSFEGTKCEFVKVQDVNNYTNEDATKELRLKITLDKYILPISGGTLMGTVKTSDNYGWQIENIGITPAGDSAYTVTYNPESLGSSGNFFLTASTNNGYDKTITINVTAGDIGGSVEFVQYGELGGIAVNPSALTFASSGESLTLSITNPSSNEWEVIGAPSWISYTPASGNASSSAIVLTASQNNGDNERSGSFVIWNRTKDETIVIPVSQLPVPYLRLVPSSMIISSQGGTATVNVESNIDWSLKISGETAVITGITIDNFEWTSNFPSSAGTYLTKDYSTFNITAHYDNGTTTDVTNEAEITGQVTLEENTSAKSRIVQAPINAKYVVLTVSAIKKGFQSGAPTPPTPTETVTGVSFSSITWTTDIPASGGTATKENCSYVVTADYNNGNRVDITTLTPDEGLLVEGSKTVSASTDTSRHSVGSLSLDITYFPEFTATTPVYTATTAITVYQEAYVKPTPSYDTPLTFEVISGGTIYFKTNSERNIQIRYSINDGDWHYIKAKSNTTGNNFTVNNGDIVKLKGTNQTYSNGTYYCYFSATTNTQFKLKGNIMSLINAENFSGITEVPMYCFNYFFENCEAVVDASELVLPATALASRCYGSMFSGCYNLLSAPELPATTLTDYCYSSMFSDCYNLLSAPELPATTLTDYCYSEMFVGCASLSYIKCLATDISANGCTQYWVNNVASTGTFVKNISMTGWTTGNSGIPTGWTVENTVTGSSIIVGTVSGGTIGLGTGCAANFNGSLTVSGSEVCTLTNSGNNIIVNGFGQFGWNDISYDEAKAVEFGYDWGGSYQYTNNCYLSLIITDGVNTVNGVIQKGSQSVTVDLTPFWANGTTEQITVTINATIN